MQLRAQVLDELGNEIRASQNRNERFDNAVCELLGINRTDHTAMDIVDRHGQIAAGELARELGLTTGAVTTLIDRMEAAGYLRRVRDTADRRRVLVEGTPLARKVGELIYAPIAQDFLELSTAYSTQALELILDFLRHGSEIDDRRDARLETQAAAVRKLIKRTARRPQSRP